MALKIKWPNLYLVTWVFLSERTQAMKHSNLSLTMSLKSRGSKISFLVFLQCEKCGRQLGPILTQENQQITGCACSVILTEQIQEELLQAFLNHRCQLIRR